MIIRITAATLAALAFASVAVAQDEEGEGGETSFTITNESSTTLVSLQTSEPGAAAYDNEVLDGEVGPGDSIEISTSVENCVFDVMAEYDDGDTEEEEGVDFCALDGAEFVMVDEEDDGEGEEEEGEEEEGDEE